MGLASPTTPWRRWTSAAATLHEGAANGSGPLCIVIIGFKAPKSLAAVVAAACAQSGKTEIVVVNSGGGDAAALLQSHLSRIRLIEQPEVLFVGHARNIGIDASRAPYVSFLADDCIPLDGWVAGRIARHDAGALMVASAVVPERPDSVLGHVARTLLFSKRAPTLDEDDALPYGRSYHRSVFLDVGYFAPGLRVGEDTEFNRRADILATPVWAPEIVVRHHDPRSVPEMLRDIQKRARRFASAIRPRDASGSGRDWVDDRIAVLRERTAEALDQATGLNGLERLWFRIVLGLCVQANRIGFRRADRILTRAETLAAQAATLAEGDPAQAAELLRAAIDLVPHDWKLYQALGEKLVRLQDDTTAMAVLATASAIAPTEVAPLRARTDILFRTGPRHEVPDLCEDAVIMAPQALAILLQSAMLARRRKNAGLAFYFAQSALLSDVTNLRAHGLLEDLYRQDGKPEMADRRKAMADLLHPKPNT